MLFIIGFCCLVLGQTSDYIEEDGVIVLTPDNIYQTIDKFPQLMVEFYAPWCSHCKSFAPEYSKAARLLKDDNIILAKLDGSLYSDLARDYEVTGFPTVKMFSMGHMKYPLEYNGKRTADALVKWARKKAGPVAAQLSFDELINTLNKIGDEVYVVHYSLPDQHNLVDYLVYSKECELEVRFFHCDAPEAREFYMIPQDVAVILYKNIDAKEYQLKQGYNYEELKTFVEINSQPNIILFSPQTVDQIFGDTATLIMFNDNPENEGYYHFQVASRQYKPRFKFALIDKSYEQEDAFIRLGDYLGVDVTSLPKMVLVNQKNQTKYIYEGEISYQGIQLKPYYKSEKAPEANGESVLKVVASTFQEQVIDSDKDVLIEFYAPWCSHCQQLAPIYEDFAQRVSHNQNLVIAKIDGSQNEIPNLTIESFPSIFLYQRGHKQDPVEYTGSRTIVGFLNFLKKYDVHNPHQTEIEDL